MCMSKIPTEISFQSAITACTALGCTIVFNKIARDMLIKKMPEHAIFHDWWIYLVLVSHGIVFFDQVPYIDYRQHSNNVVGMICRSNLMINKIIGYFRSVYTYPRISDQLYEFREMYAGTLKKDDLDYLSSFLDGKLSFWKRLSFMLKGKLVRKSFGETLLVNTIYALNRF